MTTLAKLKSLFYQQRRPDEELEYAVEHQGTEPKLFLLTLRGLPVGRLRHGNGQWLFEYEDEHKTRIREGVAGPVIGFPKLDVQYTSPVLWPFFHIRLPGNYIRNEPGVKGFSEVELLEQYGRKVITNPYILEVV